ncbi:MAG: hypothetical protein EOP49_15795 [Sphingobacteriales bacterium]|nr:MAG: hypothetical protein EOP49_15795 [Sphingobacteriales bacterium]
MFRRSLAVCLLFISMCITGEMKAQSTLSVEDAGRISKLEDSLILVADSMYNAFIPDTRIGYCEKFVKGLVRALKTPGSYYYPFAKLGAKINIIAPDDKSFRIFNWQILPDGVRVRYFGAIQREGHDLKLTPLFDRAMEIGSGAEDSILNNSRWFGALYYRIITTESEEGPVYTLFGLNASNLVSNKKVLEPLRLTADGIVFGAPVFNVRSEGIPQNRINRFIIEYKKDVQASLNWDNELKMIYFDKLVSQTNDPKRKYTYVPSGQYDGFTWSNGFWNYVQDLIPVQEFKDGEAPTPAPLAPRK